MGNLLAKPSTVFPEHVLTLEDTVEMYRDVYKDHRKLDLCLDITKNMMVKKRHFIQGKEKLFKHPGVKARNDLYSSEARRLAPLAVTEALDNASLDARDIDLIIMVSCTGFLMPSLTSFLINELRFRNDVKQMPIAQLGCAAGASAINRAYEYCRAYPDQNVLIVCVEFSSLLYQPSHSETADLLSYALFGDAVSACVMKGGSNRQNQDKGVRVDYDASFLVPNTERYIAYDLENDGFHFVLDKNTRYIAKAIAPEIKRFLKRHGVGIEDIDYFVFHTGGPMILNNLVEGLQLPPDAIIHSRECLEECGNIASVVVFDVMRRVFEAEAEKLKQGMRGLLVGIGPGVTTEFALTTWVEH